MKTKLTLLAIILSFFLTSCYTQFATVREDDEYVVKRERQYKKYQKQQEETEDAYYEEDDEEYVEDDEYYEDEADYVTVADYHYSSRPYVYRYRFANYDPWYDEYVYYSRPVAVISVRLGPRYRSYYDPYWAGFYCSPYDYVDPWFGWCGYGYASYYPYYYGHYYHDRYYGGYYGYNGYRGYRNNYRRYSRDYYAGNWGRRPFTSSRPGRLAARPERPVRPNGVTQPDRPLEMPDSRPVVSRPNRQKQEPYTLERPVRNSREARRTQPAVYKDKKIDDDNRKYQKKYYNKSDRIKSELDNSRNEVKRTTRKRPSENVSKEKRTTKPVKKSYKYNTDRREQKRTVKPKERRTSGKSSYERSKTTTKTTTKKYREGRRTKSKTVTKPRSSSRETKSKKSYTKPRSSRSKSSSPKVRSTPKTRSSSSGSSRSSVRSAPSRSSSSGSSGRSSRSSSSGGSKSSSGKRPR